jgi:uncharacterized protein YprB with RNaseH-like and TPR domain
MSPSLADKLKTLGVKVGTGEIQPPPPRPRRDSALEHALEGRWIETRRGFAFVVEQVFPGGYRHGATPIRLAAGLETLAAWAGDERLASLPVSKLAFLDTETSGLAGGTGTYAFMVGLGRFVEDEFHLAQFFMPDPADEAALLEALADFLAPCAALVTFNGKAFDAPLLRTRYTLNQSPCPLDGFAHLDLLPLARRLWRDRLPSRALKYLEEHILQAPRSAEEVPGYEIPWLYFDFLRTGDAAPLKGVFYHNAMDIVAMAALLSLTARMLADPHAFELEHGLDVIALAKLFEDLNRWEDAALLYERGLQTARANGAPLSEQALSEPDFWQAVRRLAVLQKRRGDLDVALRLWEKSAAEGHIYAHVELAKYYEHTRKEPAAALQWTVSAMAHVRADLFMPAYMKNHWLSELEHRQKRLEGKLK